MAAESTINSERLSKIEHMLAYQEQQIHDLSDMVNLQWKEIDRLKNNLKQTAQRLESLETTPKEGGIDHEIPPHY